MWIAQRVTTAGNTYYTNRRNAWSERLKDAFVFDSQEEAEEKVNDRFFGASRDIEFSELPIPGLGVKVSKAVLE